MGFSDILRGIEMVDLPRGVRPTHASALLLYYSRPKADVRRVVELGSGSGIVSIGIAKFYKKEVVGIEIDRELVEIARKSAGLNGVDVEFVNADVSNVAEFFEAEGFDMVVSNPPHHLNKVKSPLAERAVSRNLDESTVEAFVNATFYLLKNGGDFAFVLNPESMMIWIEKFLERRLQIKRMVFFHPKDRAELVALRGRKNAKIGLVVDFPILGG